MDEISAIVAQLDLWDFGHWLVSCTKACIQTNSTGSDWVGINVPLNTL